MARVYSLLKENVDAFQPVCELLEGHVLNPIISGKKLGIEIPKLSATGSFLTKLEEARKIKVSGTMKGGNDRDEE
jgi:hypothetical protein